MAQRNYEVCHVVFSRFVIFFNFEKIQYFDLNGFCGWSQISEMGSSRTKPTASGSALAPGPAGDIFKITGPSSTRFVSFQSH